MTKKHSYLDRIPLSKQQTLGEEIANCITHGIGVALSIVAIVILVVISARQGSGWKIVSFSIYGTALFILYLASTLYHAFPHSRIKRLFRIFDHSSIFLLIAGTYTPVTLIALRGGWGWTLFGVIWGLAIAGINLEIFTMKKFRFLSIAIYIAMGWMIVMAIKPLLRVAPPGMIAWMLVGGICYTGGVLFYVWKRLAYHHFIWHLFVLAGSICHFFRLLMLEKSVVTG